MLMVTRLTAGITVNPALLRNTDAVVRESCAKIKVQMLQISYDTDVVALILQLYDTCHSKGTRLIYSDGCRFSLLSLYSCCIRVKHNNNPRI